MHDDSALLLGFAEPRTEESVEEQFPSKLGGTPKWMLKNHPLTVDQVRCVCGRPMTLLLQLYAPEDNISHAFHRTMFVFVCKNGKCHHGPDKEKALKVFRCQIDEDMCAAEDNIIDKNEYCVVCNLAGSKVCGKCKKTFYCSKEHQLFHWNVALHKQLCNTKDIHNVHSLEVLNQCDQSKFPEFDILSENENFDTQEVEELTELSKAVVISKETESSVEEDETTNTKIDVYDAFMNFQKRIRHDPEQILRYARTETDVNPHPLLVSSSPLREIEPCGICGHRRTFEFQIMPQILAYLQIDNADPLSFDFGTLLIYSCENSCDYRMKSRRMSQFVEEVIIRQDYSSDGIGKEFRKGRFGIV